MPILDDLYEGAASAGDYVAGFRDRFVEMVRSLDVSGATEVIRILEQVDGSDRSVYVLGNGGSAAVAAHWVNDLGVNSLVDNRTGFRVYNLADNPSALTAVGNDAAFEDIFLAQLRSYLRPGDVVIALSVSGNSANVIKAIQYASQAGAETIAFTGMNGGELKTLANVSVHVQSDVDEYGPVEDMFSVFMHIATGYIAMRRGRHLYH